MTQFKFNQKNIYVVILLAIIVFISLFFWGNARAIINNFKDFQLIYLPLILGLALINYFLRFLKWQIYLDRLNIKLERIFSLKVFFAGLAFSITPAKLGEVFKSYILKKTYSIAISKTAPIVFVDRLTDFISILFLVSLGVFVFRYGLVVFLISFVLALVLIIILSSKKICDFIVRMLIKIKFLARFSQHLKTAFDSSRVLLKAKPLIMTIFLSLIAWSAECLAFFLVFKGLAINSVSVLAAFFNYAFSTLVGAISMIPGGLGLQEASMTGILVLLHLDRADAATATLIIRLCTLWFAVILGTISLFLNQNQFAKKIK